MAKAIHKTASAAKDTTDYQGNNRMVVNGSGGVEQVTHYYPYGGVIGDISTDGDFQKNKFLGKELDRKFGLDWYDDEARMYDAIGVPRFTSIDPLAEKYYHLSPYSYCGGDPVNRVDPTGTFIVAQLMIDNGDYKRFFYNIENKSFVSVDGEKYNGNNQFLLDLTTQINTLCEGSAGKDLINMLVNSEKGVLIVQGKNNREADFNDFKDENVVSGIIYSGKSNVSGGTGYTSLGHELTHARDRINEVIDVSTWLQNCNEGKSVKKAEISATYTENLIRAEHGLPLRKSYMQNEDGTPDYSSSVVDSKGRSLFYNSSGNHLPGFKKVN